MRPLLAFLAVIVAAAEGVTAAPANGPGLYLALGGSTAVGVGASSRRTSYVGLYFEHLQATGTGVSLLSNLAVGGVTTTTLLESQPLLRRRRLEK